MCLVFTCILSLLALSATKDLPYDLIIVGPHHKTGTIQTQCIMHEWAEQHGWPFAAGRMTPHADIWSDVPEALIEIEAYAKSTGYPRPYVLGTWKTHHHCDDEGCPPRSLIQCSRKGDQISDCTLSIPNSRLLHAYRNPMATLFSSMAYHTQPSIPNMENWLGNDAKQSIMNLAKTSEFANKFINDLVDEHLVDGRTVTLHGLMHDLPFEKCLTLNYLLGRRELQEAAFVRKVFLHSPQVINIRFEDMSHQYNHTIEEVFKFFHTDKTDAAMTMESFVNDVQYCDPYTWTAADAAQSDHLTSHHQRAFTPDQALEVLAAVPEIWEAMCGFCKDLGYVDEGCEKC